MYLPSELTSTHPCLDFKITIYTNCTLGECLRADAIKICREHSLETAVLESEFAYCKNPGYINRLFPQTFAIERVCLTFG